MKLCEGEQEYRRVKDVRERADTQKGWRAENGGSEVDVLPARRRENSMTSEIHTVNCKRVCVCLCVCE